MGNIENKWKFYVTFSFDPLQLSLSVEGGDESNEFIDYFFPFLTLVLSLY